MGKRAGRRAERMHARGMRGEGLEHERRAERMHARGMQGEGLEHERRAERMHAGGMQGFERLEGFYPFAHLRRHVRGGCGGGR